MGKMNWAILMEKPANLTPMLGSIRDASIDYAIGRTKKEPDNLDALYQWYLTDGYGDEVDIIDDVVFLDIATEVFTDVDLASAEGWEISDITDSERLDYAKRLIESLLEAPWFVMIKHIENDKGEKAFIGYLEEEYIQEIEVGTYWYGIYSSEKAFIEHLEKDESMKSPSDIESLTDEEILSYWH